MVTTARAHSTGPHRRHVFVFGAQGTEFTDQLELLLQQCDTHAPLTRVCRAFFAQALQALVEESSRLSPEDLATFPGLSDMASLRSVAACGSHAAIAGFLLCATQVATFLLAAEAQPDLLDGPLAATGLCSGVLPAAAVVLSRTALDVATVGVDLCRLALWVGLESARNNTGQSRSRALVLYGRNVDEARVSALTQAFNAHTDGPDVYISSVVSSSNITVSGPPAQLDLFQTALSAPIPAEWLGTGLSLQHLRLPVCSPYHSSDLNDAAERVIAKAQERGVTQRLGVLQAGLDGELRKLLYPCDLPATMTLIPALVHTILTQVNRWEHIELRDAGEVALFYGDKGARSLCARFVDAQPTALITLAAEHRSNDSQPVEPTDDDRIAIVSLSCRFPNGADTPEKFWSMLEEQVDCCREIPPHLFDWKAYRERKGQGKQRNSLSVPWGNFLDDVDAFDHQLFNMSPKESMQLDPQHRFTLMCCYEAMEEAGYAPEQLASYRTTRLGCFIGASSDDYRENASSDIGAYFITGNIRAFIPGHVSFAWDLEGPSNSVDTACSSSLVAIEAACDALRNGQCDSALAGGVTILTQPQMFIGYERAGVLSPTGQCRTFADDVDGICRGDGVGVVMLKRYATAVADGDNVLGVIRACRSTYGSLDHRTHLGAPAQDVLEKLYRQTCMDARVDPHNVAYVDAHGVGERKAEAAEVNAIAQVFGHDRRRSPLYVGSSKPTFGYSEAACGMAALTSALGVLQRRRLPGTRGHTRNKLFQGLPELNVEIPSQATHLTPHGRLLAGISNLNLFGGATFLLLEEAEQRAPCPSDPRTHHVVALSAKSPKAARDLLRAYLQVPRTASLADVSYTSTARRQHFAHRFVAAGRNWDEVRAGLERAELVSIAERKPPVAFHVLAGQDPDWLATYIAAMSAASKIFRVELNNARHTGADLAAACSLATGRLWMRWLGDMAVHTRAERREVVVALVLAGATSVQGSHRWVAEPRRGVLKAPRVDIQVAASGGATLRLEAGQPIDVSALDAFLADNTTEPRLAHRGSHGFIVRRDCDSAHDNEVAIGPNAWHDITHGLARMYAAGGAIDWKAYHSEHARHLSVIKLPNYRFDLQRFWMPYQDRGLLPIAGVDQGSGDAGDSVTHEVLGRQLSQADDGSVAFEQRGLNHEHWRAALTQQAMAALCHLEREEHRFAGERHFEVSAVFTRSATPSLLTVAPIDGNGDWLNCSWTRTDDSEPAANCRVRRLASTALSRTERAVLRQASTARTIRDCIPTRLLYRLLAKVEPYATERHSLQGLRIGQGEAIANAAFAGPTSWRLASQIDAMEQVAIALTNVGLLGNDDSVGYGVRGYESVVVTAGLRDDIEAATVYAVRAGNADGPASTERVDSYLIHDGQVVAAILGVLLERGTSSQDVKAQDNRAPSQSKGDADRPAVPTTPAQPVVSTPPAPSPVSASLSALKAVMLSELGVSADDLQPDRNLADLGLDSLMSLQVLGVMREAHDVDLPASLFMDHPTLASVGAFLSAGTHDAGSEVVGTSSAPALPTSAPAAPVPVRPVLVSGASHRTHRAPIFLLPDGSGSGAVYRETPDLGMPAYAVTSPFLQAKSTHAWSVEEIAARFVECIALTHPAGQPLYLGGWSFGGIVAFEVCRLLQTSRRFLVNGVLLIDSPDPQWPPLPDTVFQWLQDAGREVPQFSAAMQGHFAATLAALGRYRPEPLASAPGSLVVVNALKGVGGRPEDVEQWNSTVGWLQESREGLGAHGWERYVSRENLRVVQVDADHFEACSRGAWREIARDLSEIWHADAQS
ncbi:unnamed protein product [Parajaminaea phylloscopi]